MSEVPRYLVEHARELPEALAIEHNPRPRHEPGNAPPELGPNPGKVIILSEPTKILATKMCNINYYAIGSNW